MASLPQDILYAAGIEDEWNFDDVYVVPWKEP